MNATRRKFLQRPDALFWWESFSLPEEAFLPEDDRVYWWIPAIIPESADRVWLIAGLTDERMPVFDCDPQIVPNLLGECPSFEYAIVDKSLEWLICENHHGYLVAVGEKAIARLREVRPS